MQHIIVLSHVSNTLWRTCGNSFILRGFGGAHLGVEAETAAEMETAAETEEAAGKEVANDTCP